MGDGFFYRFIKAKNPNSRAYKKEVAKKVCSHPLTYISKAEGSYGENIVGRGGRCELRGKDFAVSSSEGTVFICALDDAKVFELMSLDGATVAGVNRADGKYTELTVHYK